MTTFYNYGPLTESSSPTESFFNDVTNRIFCSNTWPIRIDKFIIQYVKNIQGAVKITEMEISEGEKLHIKQEKEILREKIVKSSKRKITDDDEDEQEIREEMQEQSGLSVEN